MVSGDLTAHNALPNGILQYNNSNLVSSHKLIVSPLSVIKVTSGILIYSIVSKRCTPLLITQLLRWIQNKLDFPESLVFSTPFRFWLILISKSLESDCRGVSHVLLPGKPSSSLDFAKVVLYLLSCIMSEGPSITPVGLMI